MPWCAIVCRDVPWWHMKGECMAGEERFGTAGRGGKFDTLRVQAHVERVRLLWTELGFDTKQVDALEGWAVLLSRGYPDDEEGVLKALDQVRDAVLDAFDRYVMGRVWDVVDERFPR